ncbi:zinc finger protein 567-like [Ochlerotatus camptorhynchus]|uniref:zinc finger protein 567-like n=1 Tax=Ochlerotatus camptorhynchus TaxID=644619 RepID=UPI0031CF863B
MSEEPIAKESTRRTYGRRVLLCRLCLHEYPNDDLHEIFTRGSDWKKRITRAVGIKPHRNDYATRICTTCRMMIDLIACFQDICQQTERLMVKGHTLSADRWKQASGLIDSLWSLMDRHRETVLEADEPVETAIIETEQEIFKVTVPEERPCEFMEEIKEEEKGDADEQKSVLQLDIKEEEDEDDNQDYNYEVDLVGDVADSDQEEVDEEEEEEKPKRKRGRRKQNYSERKMKNEKVMCDTCGELISQVCLEGHLNRHLGVKPFVCEIEGCGRRLYSKYSLQQHRHLHKSIMRFYDCQDCGKRIKGTNCWMRHRKLHTEDPKHECDVCGKKFRRKFGLKLHSVVHTGVALFPCEICGKRFTVKHNLGAHYKTHMRNGTYPAQQQRIQEEEEKHSYPAEQEQNCSMRYDSVQ